jgi:hypothetical protein
MGGCLKGVKDGLQPARFSNTFRSLVSNGGLRAMSARMPLAVALAALGLAGAVPACATAPAIGRGGPVYAVRVASVDGHPTSMHGPVGNPACTLQIGDRVVRVWVAHPSHHDAPSPVITEADEAALKAGVLVERSWGEAIVHHVTAAELAAGAAVVYIPSTYHLTTVELSFEPVKGLDHSQHEHDFTESPAGLENPMASRHVR